MKRERTLGGIGRAAARLLLPIAIGLISARYIFYRSFEWMPNRDGLAPAVFAFAGAVTAFAVVTALASVVTFKILRNRG